MGTRSGEFRWARNLGSYGVMGVAVGVALAFVSCGGGGGGDSTPPETRSKLDAAGAQKAIDNVKAVVPVCTKTAGAAAARAGDKVDWFKYALDLRRVNLLRRGPTKHALAYGPTKPVDKLGACGGKLTYPVYSHVNGVTTATLQYDNYCTVNPDSGNKQTLNGSISFVDTATPTPTGPIATKLEASSAGNITARSVDAAGNTVGQQTMSFNGFVMTMGVPSGTPTAANPDRLQLSEAKFANSSGANYRETNLSMVSYETATGDQIMTVSGRGYRSNGDVFDYTTSAPLTMNAAGDYVSGAVNFTGADGTAIIVTVVPGPDLQATMTVNGVPYTAVPACKVTP